MRRVFTKQFFKLKATKQTEWKITYWILHCPLKKGVLRYWPAVMYCAEAISPEALKAPAYLGTLGRIK